GPIDSTLRASTIAEPMYGYDPSIGKEVTTGTPGSVTVMAVDNLPCELPRDASEAFGDGLVARVFPALLGDDPENMIGRATICRAGRPTEQYQYLHDWAQQVPLGDRS
ncbi:MAG: alanine dehydrogenase, partial [Flavobacteriales bacterium]|nr:alanine dehydrogenase [Flavobacteriales bacterium]